MIVRLFAAASFLLLSAATARAVYQDGIDVSHFQRAIDWTSCVLLIVLWVRSYWWQDQLHVNYAGRNTPNYSGTKTVSLISVQGRIVVSNKPMRWDPPITLEHSEVLSPHVFQDDHGQTSTSAWFRIMRYSRFTEVLVPYWFLALSSGALAIVPWPRRRFSIRTLLIATTLVAVMLGLICYVAR